MTIMALTRGIWSNDYFAVSSLICMVMAIYSGHKMLSGKKKPRKNWRMQKMNNEPTLCPLGTKLAQSLWCQEKSWHLFLCLFTL